SDALLRGANLTKACLVGANLTRADLRDTALQGACVGGTLFVHSDLSQVQGLEELEHLTPSYISIDTLYLSQSQLSTRFLRQAGVPDSLQRALSALLASHRSVSCSLAYTSADQPFAEQLCSDLRHNGVSCWLTASMPGALDFPYRGY